MMSPLGESGTAAGTSAPVNGPEPAVRRALVFESDPNVRKVLSEYLSGDQWDARFANTAEELLRQTEEFRPDVVVPQFLIPNADGLDVCRQLRAARPRAEMRILVTSFLSAEDWVVDAGADAFVRRPLSKARFLAAMNRLHGQVFEPSASAEAAAVRRPVATSDRDDAVSMEGGTA